MPGTHVVSASFKDPKTGKFLKSRAKEVKIPEFVTPAELLFGRQKTNAIRFDFKL